jgi:hypothetical protein
MAGSSHAPISKASVFKIDPDNGERLGVLTLATVGEGGWVDVTEPIIVKAGDAFFALLDDVIASDTGRPSGQR